MTLNLPVDGSAVLLSSAQAMRKAKAICKYALSNSFCNRRHVSSHKVGQFMPVYPLNAIATDEYLADPLPKHQFRNQKAYTINHIFKALRKTNYKNYQQHLRNLLLVAKRDYSCWVSEAAHPACRKRLWAPTNDCSP